MTLKLSQNSASVKAQVSLLSHSGFKLSRVREEFYFEQIKQFGFSFMVIDFTSHLHQTKRKVLHWQTFMHMTINYLNSSHIILKTRIYEIDLYGFEARLNNPYSFFCDKNMIGVSLLSFTIISNKKISTDLICIIA